jgi:hypothetical protein
MSQGLVVSTLNPDFLLDKGGINTTRPRHLSPQQARSNTSILIPSFLIQTMEVGALLSVEESDLIVPLLGEQYFEDYNSDFTSCFSSSYHSCNWPQEDSYVGINWDSHGGYCNIHATEITKDIINPKSIKRTCEIESELDSCRGAPKKKARNSTTVSYS